MPVDNPLQNAAALLMMLSAPEAQGILGRLQPHELAQLRLAVAAIDPAHALLQPDAGGAADTVPPRLRPGTPAPTRSRLLGGPGHYVQSLLEQSFGRSFAESAAAEVNLAGHAGPSSGSLDTRRGPGMDRLRAADTASAVQVIAAEHPQAAAAILAATGPDFAARVLQLVPPRQRAELMLRLARTGPLSAAAMEDLDAGLHFALDALAARKGRAQGGASLAAQVLERLGRPQDVAVMEHLKATDPALAERIERRRDAGASSIGAAA